MRRLQPDRASTSSPDDVSASASGTEQDSALERYRMYGHFYDRYWSQLFGMTQADMMRFATQMRDSGEAMTLTAMARDVIRVRLQAGPQLRSGPAAHSSSLPRTVRPWDPGVSWREGDQAIVIVDGPSRGRAYAPRVGEILHVRDDRLVMAIDGMSASQVFELGPGGTTRDSVAAEAEMSSAGRQFDEEARIDFVLWRYGTRVVAALLNALDADSRFMALEGWWFLRELAQRPSDATLARLAQIMFEKRSGAVRPDDICALLSIPGPAPLAVRFGLAQSIAERTDLFENTGSATYPRWRLSGPPPAVFVAQRAVYDPETYVVLCMPGEPLSPDVLQRLWDTGLLRAAITAAAEPVTDLKTHLRPGVDSDAPASASSPALDVAVSNSSSTKPNPRFWSRLLRSGKT